MLTYFYKTIVRGMEGVIQITMREIKFRAWRKDTEEMFDDIQFADFEGEKIVHEQSLNKAFEIAQNTFFEIMQYTGLKDKNGKEIYEGDVLQLAKGDDSAIYACVVTFNNETGAFACRKIDEDKPYSDHMYGSHIVEVIGNIYQDGHLFDK